MFTEELAVNKGRQKAQSNQQKRREFLLRKQKQEEAAAAAAVTASSSKTNIITNTSIATATTATTIPITTISSSSSVTANSAVQQALQMRSNLEETARVRASCRIIQSLIRRFLSNIQLYSRIKDTFVKRMNDLKLLNKLTSSSARSNSGRNNQLVMLPQLMIRQLAAQFLFVYHKTKSSKYSSDERKQRNGADELPYDGDVYSLLDLLIQYAVLPPLQQQSYNEATSAKSSSSNDIDPFLPWLDFYEGRLRAASILDACIDSYRYNESAYTYINEFMKAILLKNNSCCHEQVIKFCLNYFQLSFDNETQIQGGNDVLAKLKSILETSNRTKDHRCCAGDSLFKILMEVVLASNNNLVHLKFVVEIMTVPCLPNKLNKENVEALVTMNPAAKPVFLSLVSSINLKALLKAVTTNDMPALLGNLIQLGQICSALNPTKLHSQSSVDNLIVYFEVLAPLLSQSPLGVLSSKESSVVDWYSSNQTSTHITPILLKEEIVVQCSALCAEWYVRALFVNASIIVGIDVEKILSTKNEEDKKLEEEMNRNYKKSAKVLVMEEARKKEKRFFWEKSNWGKQISKKMSNLFQQNDKNGKSKDERQDQLMNNSKVSLELACGQREISVNETNDSRMKRDCPELLYAICALYSIVLAKWGGRGSYDVVNNEFVGDDRQAANKPEVCTVSLLNTLSFSTPLVKTLWALMQSSSVLKRDLKTLLSEGGSKPLRCLAVGISTSFHHDQYITASRGAMVLFLFSYCLSHTLVVTDEIEIHDLGQPLPLHQLRRFILMSKDLLFKACCTDVDKKYRSSISSHPFGLAFISCLARSSKDLYDRSSRQPLCLPSTWVQEDLLEKDLRRCRKHEDYVAMLSIPILNVVPGMVPFKRRLKLFEKIVETNRVLIQGSHASNTLQRGINVRIMRGRILEDGLYQMNKLGPHLRQRLVIQYINEAGAAEKGIDVGGLFKDFWTDLSALAFNQQYALFVSTKSSELYPNPSSKAAHGNDHVVLFEYVGRILGKALYEGITVSPMFSHFFLSFLRGNYNYLHMLPDLSTVDPELYNNLMFLKNYDGDARDLSLTFTVLDNDFGSNTETPLVYNGENIDVTNTNKHRYIGLVAKHHVCDRVKEQAEAFTRGLWEVIDRKWLKMFNEPELQVLISGATEGKISVDDLKAHTRYQGGYTGLDRNVIRFWSVFKSLSPEQQGALLRFVTSCERPPPLGFASLSPPFTIQKVSISSDDEKLPSASTCFNVLKLPTYSSEKAMKQRLIYVIESGAGFELS